jgi:rhomboid family GlyGly-CTERM serine protease
MESPRLPGAGLAANGLLRVLALLLPLALLAALAGAPGRLLLRYEPAAVLHGQLWRLFTAHLAHLGWAHLALNAAGLVLVALLFGPCWRPAAWWLFVLASALGVSLGLLVASPNVSWYVGLSGVAHGLFAAGAAGAWRERRGSVVLALLALVAKLAWEQAGGRAAQAAWIGGATIVDAHLYGALAGLAAALLMAARRRTA